ncbi:MAG: metalloregulator ArsR/SmtB family transcription factor [Tissierellales bacterium]|jgi:ArsR family transcriptional regulator|nr:metalloregulator ArsR/SmtB family transcription factor [Tissierellales bacterium]
MKKNEECHCGGETLESLEIVKEAMIGEDEIYEIARLLKIFSDPTRLKVLSALSHSELCVQHLTEVVEMTQSAVSHQLRTLKAERLVKARRSGKMIYYSLADDHIQKILDMALEHIRE